jgi:DnaJ-class molecular chaperone
MENGIKCPSCEGSGFSVNMDNSCPTCEGTGEIYENTI